ncbi:hypothetical protein [Actinokineospora inagensis]|uniref:hypothetical protein n=1 Tax=Actinokineospora inagensis TaxID=103730 RepID=UPI0003FCFE9B|nr:hypothetical protein [Actinokineospora inagensis]
MVIDPAGTLGDPEFDAVDYVLGAADVAARCADLAAITDLSAERLDGWCRAMAPLVAIGQQRLGRPIDHLVEYLDL